MSSGDLIFFFKDRLLYGPGRVVSATPGPAARLNYPGSFASRAPMPLAESAVYGPALDPEGWYRVRVVVFFCGAPILFRSGIDMDEVLASYMDKPWGLHYWSNASFVQLAAPEAKLLQEAFLRRFAGRGLELDNTPECDAVTARAAQCSPLSFRAIVNSDRDAYVHPDGRFRSEDALHAAVVEELHLNSVGQSLYNVARLDIFHELPASPPKKPVWVDKLDVVASNSWPASDIVTSFDVYELKKDSVSAGPINTFERRLSQPLRYLDFMGRHYVAGNLHAVGVHLMAFEFSKRFIEEFLASAILPIPYSLSPRDDAPIRRWQRVRLWRYRWTNRLEIQAVQNRWSDEL
jgi:hypothetical protein